jgi:mannan endo-1,4-beta-mannosidase
MTTPPQDSPAAVPPEPQKPGRRSSRRFRILTIGAVVIALAAVATVAVVKVSKPTGSPPSGISAPPIGTYSHHPVRIALPARAASYLGAFVKGNGDSYTPMESFASATGSHFNLALYYSGWYEKFQDTFAIQAKQNGAVPFIQIDPAGIPLAAIAHGLYDTYLKTIATDIAGYGATTGQGVIIGFGHEMNGRWFSWGYKHVRPALFVAAWRHIVTVFRQQGAYDVTWLWTVNIVNPVHKEIPSPVPWWPGSAYVTWVGIDGYYLKPSWTFASLFGPTIKIVKSLTFDPILISETGASPVAGQPAKVADLFAGVRNYGLLGFVWFDSKGTQNWHLSTPAAFAAFRQGFQTFDEIKP